VDSKTGGEEGMIKQEKKLIENTKKALKDGKDRAYHKGLEQGKAEERRMLRVDILNGKFATDREDVDLRKILTGLTKKREGIE